MKKLLKGEYFGNHYNKNQFDDLLITDTKYTHAKVDWHYHENPYFTYLLQGKLYEENKKENYYLKSGSLLFHNWQDAHYNIKPDIYTRGFHIEMNTNWFDLYDIKSFDFEGSMQLKNPLIQQKMNCILLESKIKDQNSQLAINMLLVDIFNNIKTHHHNSEKQKPNWVKQLKEILHSSENNITSLSALSTILNIHPVHLSREFPKYFKTTIGNYIRTQKINKALLLIAKNKLSMTEVCYEAGFYDQSHFITSLKKIYGQTPLKISKKIGDVNLLQF
ncbi:AraC family transcriptional regulator [Polaribacter reichenbachii]|uniref:AraC family transcriptional regulator n=1 Tax=Polaribacter reichenbachii TaxID=996801 RepID=A0A1B8TPL4_9FLAO|nr:AraC family transcriptional regulator [Polaribacter reichenbachii]APZ46945.1 AraC family transcriptional regulator [Polaribacter reichenbachii]AUC17588.1 AraC family transcriptional regulator [Polaribacter reichenbachii]OBY61539.1 AraC family transcriptional regulator [Polaribacter reichenbachii]